MCLGLEAGVARALVSLGLGLVPVVGAVVPLGGFLGFGSCPLSPRSVALPRPLPWFSLSLPVAPLAVQPSFISSGPAPQFSVWLLVAPSAASSFFVPLSPAPWSSPYDCSVVRSCLVPSRSPVLCVALPCFPLAWSFPFGAVDRVPVVDVLSGDSGVMVLVPFAVLLLVPAVLGTKGLIRHV